ncbi:MAG: hypothetical protein RIB98_08275 [Acidimicrobiales bacterium]
MKSFWPAAQPFEDPDDGDALVWLSEQWWTVWVFLVISLVVGLWILRSIAHHRGRGRQISAAAADAGMDYREQDGFGLSRVGFHHMASGDGRGWTASHVVTLTGRDGAKVHTFDVRAWTEFAVNTKANGDRTMARARVGNRRAGDRITRKHQGATRSAAMAPLPIHAPRLVIGRERLVSKAFATATRIDLDVESEFFNRNYHVIGEDRRFAREILDAQMIDYMVSTEGKITFEFLGGWLLLHTVQVTPDLVPGLARLADEMRRAVPPLVVQKWGSGGGVQTVP